jgi:hypothetical protein
MKPLCPPMILLPLFALCLPQVTSASIIFHFEDTERNVENATFLPQSGPSNVTVKTSGHLVGPGDPADAALSYVTPLGLGVNNTTVTPDDRMLVPLTLFNTLNTYLVDSQHGGEFIRFEFSVPFRVELLWLRDAGPGERFSLLADGQRIDIVGIFGTDEITKIHPAGMIAFPGTMPYATTYDLYAHSSFLAANFHGDARPAVPEPTAALVWCGLSATILVCRRRRGGRGC